MRELRRPPGPRVQGEGYPTPTDERHCVNSVSIRFDEKAEAAGAKDEAKTAEVKGEVAKV